MKTVLIAGATGVVGESAVAHFAALGDWQVIAVSRRPPEPVKAGAFRHLAVDLTDAAACAKAFGELTGVTHVVYAALFEKPGLIAGWRERDQMETNLSMLKNLLEPLADASKGLRHVTLLQGTKAYGVHVQPQIPLPARERAPRHDHENFYWLQEDYLRAKAAERGWSWTIFRPQLIVGAAWGVAMNPVLTAGVFGSILKEEGKPFSFPGGSAHVGEIVDPRLLAEAFAWAAESPAAADETFNVTNGDVYNWREVWPAMAGALGMQVGPDEPVKLADYLPSKAQAWQGIVERHGLRPIPLMALLGESHHYGDRVFRYGVDKITLPTIVSTVKLRQAGFTRVFDSEDTLRYWLGVLMERKIIPAA
jgi:nucleoside-diphosphate-sugar epimerase